MSRTFRINQLNTKTKNWMNTDSIAAGSFAEAVRIVASICKGLFPGKRIRKLADGISIKSAGMRYVISEDHNAVEKK